MKISCLKLTSYAAAAAVVAVADTLQLYFGTLKRFYWQLQQRMKIDITICANNTAGHERARSGGGDAINRDIN